MHLDARPNHAQSAGDRLAESQQRRAMGLSLAVGLLMLAGKWWAYRLTNSAAILSDAAESVVHVAAVGFAAFSLWLSHRPADERHQFGHDKIAFFSAGMEGMLILLAAIFIVYEAITRWVVGLELHNLGAGVLWVAPAAAINLGLGLYLVVQGRRHRSLILVANGKHVLTDSWTSLGVIVGVLLVMWTGWLPFDPILAILVAGNIIVSGLRLMRESFGGLMDESDPENHRRIVAVLDEATDDGTVQYHELRHRRSGRRLWVEVHLLFPQGTTVEVAHRQATQIESAIAGVLDDPATVITHLESQEQHEDDHREFGAEPGKY